MKQSGAGSLKQFSTVLKFELWGYLLSKAFIGATIFLIAVAGIGMFVPRIVTLFSSGDQSNKSADASTLPIMLVTSDMPENDEYIREAFASKFPDHKVVLTHDTLDSIKEQITSEHAQCAFAVRGLSFYTYYVKNASAFDTKTTAADETMKHLVQTFLMAQSGMSSEQMKTVMSPPIQHTVEGLANVSSVEDQRQGVLWSFVVSILLSYSVVLYGQLLVMSVVVEKSSRVMEVLITSVKPKNMIFGKITAVCIAVFIQALFFFCTLFLCYYLNRAEWQSFNPLIPAIFEVSPHIVVYAAIFFSLGFLLYAFVFAMFGSLIPKVENINSSGPVSFVSLVLMVGFYFTLWLTASGETQSIPALVGSFVPFFAPMVMFMRMTTDVVPLFQVILSIGILLISNFLIGILSAKVYRVGVLMSGTKPKIKTILWAMKETEKRA